MSDLTIPDRVSIETHSPYYWPKCELLGVKLDGVECANNVVEFCVSGGWVRQWIVVNGHPRVERGRYLAFTKRGKVEPFWRKQRG